MSDLTTTILTEIRDELKGTNTHLERIDGRLEGIDGRLECIDGRLEGVDGKLVRIEGRLDKQEAAIVKLVDLGERHEKTLAKLIGSVDDLNTRFDNFLTGAHQEAHQEERRRYEDLDARVTVLESKRKRPA